MRYCNHILGVELLSDRLVYKKDFEVYSGSNLVEWWSFCPYCGCALDEYWPPEED